MNEQKRVRIVGGKHPMPKALIGLEGMVVGITHLKGRDYPNVLLDDAIRSQMFFTDELVFLGEEETK